jgi:soluble P-type ATPase
MLEINIPGTLGLIKIKNLVFDYNGTLAIDGKLIPQVRRYLCELSKKVKIYVITADTFGSAEKGLEEIPCELIKVPSENQVQFKTDYIKLLGADRTIAFGNGRNDKLMLKEAKIGIAVIQPEGASPETILNADIVCNNIIDALELLSKYKRLKATLRD